MLIEEGALVPLGARRAITSGWADPIEHARMLHDDRRTSDSIAALTAAVRPQDVVLDIGTGSGVLAIAAVRAGARYVYAIEASDIAEVAERVFAANGVRDRVTLLPGWSRQIELPEPADLLVSEIIGNEPFEEEVADIELGDINLVTPRRPSRSRRGVRCACITAAAYRERRMGSPARSSSAITAVRIRGRRRNLAHFG